MQPGCTRADFDSRVKIFHELMTRKVRDILLVSSLYDACIMEEDGRLSERIINEYRGLNLSQPPRITWASTAQEALQAVADRPIDLVITMPRLVDMDAFALGQTIKEIRSDLPVILVTHSALLPENAPAPSRPPGIDRIYAWSGNTDLLLALIKSVEDRWNVDHDTRRAGIRVILFVEDSPVYAAALLPILYKEVVLQIQAAMEDGLNEEHRLLTMRARPKIIVAETFEEAERLWRRFEPYVLGVISDVRFPRGDALDPDAGVDFLSRIKAERFDIPLLLTSSESSNREKAEKIAASFVDKNSLSLLDEVRHFFTRHLGFGDFVFRMPDGREIARASSFRALEKILPVIPDDSFYYHWTRNDFSRWLFARTEITVAARIRPVSAADFADDVARMRRYLMDVIRARRKRRQRGVVADFDADDFDPETNFTKIGRGSLGGKARGLVFISAMLRRYPRIQEKFPDVDILVPRTLVITAEGFDDFVANNYLKDLSKKDIPDGAVAEAFLKATFPEWIERDLAAYLAQVTCPLSIRSSSLLEDAQFKAYAGLYRTYMLPNRDPNLTARLEQLICAIKLVYASTYFQGPKAFAQRVGHRTEEEKMAVIIQEMIGRESGGFYYPAISGVAQSHNYYPFERMKPEDGIATIALGMGKTVAEGARALRFCPRHPQLLPQFSAVEDVLKNAQRFFYALEIQSSFPRGCGDIGEKVTLIRREIDDAAVEPSVRLLASTYVPQDHRIRETAVPGGYPVLTFNRILKYGDFPLCDILNELLQAGQEGMGCPVEIEFAVDLPPDPHTRPTFAFLQIRPMSARMELKTVEILREDIRRAFCYSTHALGNAERTDIRDIVYIKPEAFDPGRTVEMAAQVGRLNAGLVQEGRKYLLIGPGRWGSADRWLGIPVNWADISGVGAVVETTSAQLNADPSQGSHFFHNITTLGINYLTVREGGEDFMDWRQVAAMPAASQTDYIVHARLKAPVSLKVDGRTSRGVMWLDEHPS